ncbi:MAG: InlB B-repeat-containing protein, partial [Clostridiales bacterium]|nr:InlB B-repeat-containing protein [Clostridiales bacterium]
MKIKRMTATLLAVVMLAIICCGALLSCAEDTSSDGKEYTIYFNANGGAVNPTSARTVDGKLSSLPTPIKENSEFLGWFISNEFTGKRLTVDYKYKFSCQVHAKWGEVKQKEYTVSFDSNGGTLAADTRPIETVNCKLPSLPADPLPPANSLFIGWYTEKTVGEEVNTAYEFSGEKQEVTVYAHYIREYTITFDAGEGRVSERSRITIKGRLIDALPTPTGVPSGTRFIGWYTKKTNGEKVSSSTVFNSDCFIYARYLENNRYVINFDANKDITGEIVAERYTNTDGHLEDFPDSPTPEYGYGFSGWYTKKTAGAEVTTETKFYYDDTVYAQYVLVEFWVSFDANGGRLSESTSMMTVDKKLERLPYRPFAPAGKRFEGWYTEKEGGDKVDTDYEFPDPPTTIKLYAHYAEAVIRSDGLWLEDVSLDETVARKGEFKDPASGEFWAYDVNFKEPGTALEIWYKKALVTNVVLDEGSSTKIVLSPDKMLRLADGADISNSIINVLYKFESNLLYIQEIIRANIKDNDGIYVGSKKKKALSQNIASAEVMAENVVIDSGGTTELTVVFGGKTVEIAHFGMEETVRAQLASNKKNVIIAAGTYNFYYNYGATDPTSNDYKNLWITGRSTGNLPSTGEVNDSPYYMVGSSATLGLTWTPIKSASLIPDNIHFKKLTNTTYSLTVDLYAGNQFKILRAGAGENGWEGAFTYQNLDGNTGSTKYFANSNDIDGKTDYNIVVS